MHKRWLVDLTDAERSELGALARRGNAPARKIAHARVLLLADDGLTDEEIAAGGFLFPALRLLREGRQASTWS